MDALTINKRAQYSIQQARHHLRKLSKVEQYRNLKLVRSRKLDKLKNAKHSDKKEDIRQIRTDITEIERNMASLEKELR